MAGKSDALESNWIEFLRTQTYKVLNLLGKQLTLDLLKVLKWKGQEYRWSQMGNGSEPAVARKHQNRIPKIRWLRKAPGDGEIYYT